MSAGDIRRRSYASQGLPAGTTFDFDYTGTVQEIELPKGRYKLQCWGAQGGGKEYNPISKGGYSEGYLRLTDTTTLYAFVGGQGDGSKAGTPEFINGGWNGGGGAMGYSDYTIPDLFLTGYSYVSPGGGATDFATVTSTMEYSNRGYTNRSKESYLSRCIVAGGGAGASINMHTENKYTTILSDLQDYDYSYMVTNCNGIYIGSDVYIKIIGYKDGELVGTTSYPVSVNFHNNYSGLGTAVSGITNLSKWYKSSILYETIYSVWVYADRRDFDELGFILATGERIFSSEYSNGSQYGGGISGGGKHPGTQSYSGNSGFAHNVENGFGYGAPQTVSSGGAAAASGAGGGGWYGGGVNWTLTVNMAVFMTDYTGGGSGFVNTAANAQYRPSDYTGLELESGTTIDGSQSFPTTANDGTTEIGHSGNGYARITAL